MDLRAAEDRFLREEAVEAETVDLVEVVEVEGAVAVRDLGEVLDLMAAIFSARDGEEPEGSSPRAGLGERSFVRV